MRRISPLGAAIAGLAFALAPAALAQDTTSSSSNADSHVQDPRKDTSPSAAQNNPDRGAQDPARVGTMTQSNNDANNNRNPNTTTTTQTTTSPSTTYETTTPNNTTYTSTTTSDITPVTEPAPAPAAVPATLPKTASSMPLAGLAGLSALGAALAFRSRRLFR
ncbi:MAG TPA: LPXTG cell wall anchor domain-containing protein [Thermoanaerobaculia bacterium]|nr:LPXTG cell wall anchor domain-containing protein [Thermoanaerobaculia bacterium]